jgi:hypothetical protein
MYHVLGLSLGLSINSVPGFVWEDKASENGIPLLRVHFPGGEADDFAVLSRYNPIPQGLLEREEEIDGCIFEGFLLNEKDASVTVTGCPYTGNMQARKYRTIALDFINALLTITAAFRCLR